MCNFFFLKRQLYFILFIIFISFFFFFFFFFGCIGSLLLHSGFLQLQRAGATLRCGAQASHCSGFSCCGARALGMRASVVAGLGLSSCSTWALEHQGFSSCGTWAQLLCCMWDLPRPRVEPVSPALAGRFSTTVPPGKSHQMCKFLNLFFSSVACILLTFNFSSYFQVLFFGLSLNLPLFSFSLCMFTEILGFFRHGGGMGGGVGYEMKRTIVLLTRKLQVVGKRVQISNRL